MAVWTDNEQDIWLSIKAELWPQDWEIYKLRYQGYTFREIAYIGGKSRMWVWRRWQKIKAKIRQKVGTNASPNRL